MDNVFNLLKKGSGSGLEVQKKGIYLNKKRNEKCSEYQNENLAGFVHNWSELTNLGISLPPPGFKLLIYDQFISQNEINNMLNSNMEQFQNNITIPTIVIII